MNATANPARSQPHGAGRPPAHSTRWTLLRILLGVSGAVLVLFPVASGNSYVFSIAGLVMFIVAILLLPAATRVSPDNQARQMGALFVVDGGRYHLPNSSSSVPVQLFVGAERISALDSKSRPLLEIPTAEITSFLALQADKAWYLEVVWSANAAEFIYRGASAERLAHIAENALRRVVPAATPVIPQRRAAGA